MSNQINLRGLAKSMAVATVFVLTLWASPTAQTQAINVALGAPVELKGGAFFTSPWSGLVVDAATVTDGVFLPRNNDWNQGPVWWDSHDLVDRWVEIDLGDLYRIESFVVQADDNDGYELYYWDHDTASWVLAWDVPDCNPCGWGMQTRPNPADNTERYTLPEPIVTSMLKFNGDLWDGDRYFAVAEIQAFGELAILPVEIDIKPGGAPNPINLKSKGVVPVAVLTTDDFDASTVDPGTVLFAGASPLRWTLADVDGDGDDDLLFHFSTQELDLTQSSTKATLTGETLNGMPLEGTDTVQIVPKAKGK